VVSVLISSGNSDIATAFPNLAQGSCDCAIIYPIHDPSSRVSRGSLPLLTLPQATKL